MSNSSSDVPQEGQETREQARQQVERERAEHAAKVEAEPGPEYFRPVLSDRVRREQAEVDALLLGQRTELPEEPGDTADRAAQPAGTQPTAAQVDAAPAPAQHSAPAQHPAPDPASRVPFASERARGPVLEQPAGHTPLQPHGRRRGWAVLGGTAAAAALLASVGTAAVTGALESPAAPGTTAAPTEVVPASSTAASPDWPAVTAAVRESVVALDVQRGSGAGQGSGVVLDTAGNVLTNSHVVAGAETVRVALADGRLYEAEPVGQDETTDLAVVRLVDPPEDLVPATLGSSADLAVGQGVLAVGNPLGLDSTATTGIVSALDRPVVTQSRTQSVVTNAVQVDAAVNPGNSGGPLFDARGEVIGITSSIATLSGGGSASGSIGLGFAIPVDQAAAVAEQLVESGEAEHAFLGVGLEDTTTEVDGVTRAGAGVGQVEDGSPAAEAGLRPGDVVTAIDDRAVDGAAALTGYVRQYASGDTAVLDVTRGGSLESVEVTLATRDVQL